MWVAKIEPIKHEVSHRLVANQFSYLHKVQIRWLKLKLCKTALQRNRKWEKRLGVRTHTISGVRRHSKQSPESLPKDRAVNQAASMSLLMCIRTRRTRECKRWECCSFIYSTRRSLFFTSVHVFTPCSSPLIRFDGQMIAWAMSVYNTHARSSVSTANRLDFYRPIESLSPGAVWPGAHGENAKRGSGKREKPSPAFD